MLRDFHLWGGEALPKSCDRPSIVFLCKMMIEDPTARLMVCLDGDEYVGAASCIVCPLWYDNKHRSCQELFYWVDPEYRSGDASFLLRTAMEHFARDMDCFELRLIALAKENTPTMIRWYRRAGYKPVEVFFRKEL